MLINTLINKGMIKNDVKRFWLISLAYFVIAFFTIPFACISIMDNKGAISVKKELDNIFELDGVSALTLVFTMLFAYVLAICLNSYLHKKREMIFIHSLPTTKAMNFVSSFCSMFMILIVPMILNMFIMIGVKYAENINGVRLSTILNCYFTLFVAAILTYIFTLFVATVTGNTTFASIATVFFAMLPMIVYLAMTNIFENFVCGYINESSETIYSFLRRISPLLRLARLGNEGFTLLEYVGYIMASVILFILSIAIYKRRKNEKATETFAFSWLKAIFKYLITALSIIPSMWLFGELSNNNIVVTVIGMIVGMFFGYFVSEMVVERSIFVWNTYKGYIVCLLIFFVGVVVIKFDVFGYERRMPKREDIDSAYITIEYLDSVDMKKAKLIEDQKTIDAIYELNKVMYKNSINVFKYRKLGYFSYQGTARVKDNKIERYNSVQVIYKLKNGKIFVRRYITKLNADVQKYVDYYNSEGYKKNYYESFAQDGYKEKEEEEIYLYNGESGTTITDKNDIEKIKEALRIDYMNYEYKDDMKWKVFKCSTKKNDINISYNFIVKSEYLTKDEKESGITGAYSMNNGKYYKFEKEFIYMDENYTNTIKALKEIGVFYKVFPELSSEYKVTLYEIDPIDMWKNFEKKGESVNIFGSYELYYSNDEMKYIEEKALSKKVITDENEILKYLLNGADDDNFIEQLIRLEDGKVVINENIEKYVKDMKVYLLRAEKIAGMDSEEKTKEFKKINGKVVD